MTSTRSDLQEVTMSLAGPDSWITGGAIDFPGVEYPETEL